MLIKWESEFFVDPKTKEKLYFTHKAPPVSLFPVLLCLCGVEILLFEDKI